MDFRTIEAIRYLGYGKHPIDEPTLHMVQECFLELEDIVEPRNRYQIFKVQFQEEVLKIGSWSICSADLKKSLTGCKYAVLFSATLGIDVDRQMKKYELLNIAKAVVFQACAAAFLEEYCNQIQEEIGMKMEEEGYYLRPRFSPGYGDFSILYQKEFVQMLDTAKTIGISLTEGYMLTPSKSVTAVIGLSSRKEPCHSKGCEMCSKIDCEYRRS